MVIHIVVVCLTINIYQFCFQFSWYNLSSTKLFVKIS